jgi:hypothetical protein
VRRLAEYYTDAIIAGILNRQERRTAGGLEFTANRVGNLRRYWNIPNFDGNKPGDGELVTIQKAAEILELAPSTLHRWLSDGFIGGEQITPGAPWQIRITDELRSKFMEHPPEGYATMKEAKSILGVSRQTILNRLKTGKLSAVHVRKGKQLGLYIKVSKQTTQTHLKLEFWGEQLQRVQVSRREFKKIENLDFYQIYLLVKKEKAKTHITH